MRKLAAGYIRCSTDMQEESTSQQKVEIQKYADNNSFQIVQWFEDFGQSGTTFLKRPAFVNMLNTAEKKLSDFQFILVYDESRWSRTDPDDSVYYKQKFLKEYGIKILIVHTNSNTGNKVADGVVTFLESFEAQEYSKKLGRSTLRGCLDNARQGFSSGGSPPYGYNRIAVSKSTGEKTRVLHPGEHIRDQEEKSKWDIGDPFEVEVVRRIFDMRVKGLGYVSICDTLNRENIPPPKRGRWRNKDQRWSQGTVLTIIENPTYYGARIYNRHPQSHLAGPTKELWMNKKDDWVIVESAHPAIITKEIFEMANKNRKEYTRKNRHFYESPYLFSGLIKCSHCGFNFQGQTYTTQKLMYYTDGGYMNKGKSVCQSFRIRKEKLEKFVVNSIRSKILKSDLPDRLEEMLSKRLKESSSERLTALTQYERSVTDVKIKINRLLTAVENGVEYEMTVDRLKEAQKEKKMIEQKIDEIKSANLSKKDITDAKEQIKYLMDNFEDLIKTSPLHVQKELLRKFIHSIVVDRETDTINLYLKKIPTLKTGYAGNQVLVNDTSSNGDIVTVKKQLKQVKKANVLTED